MDYKVEIMVEKTIIFSKLYKGYSHPNQVIKLAAKDIQKRYDYMSIFVMNKYGEVWNYVVEKKDKGFQAWPVAHSYRNKNEVMMVFAGSTSIYEVLGGAQ